MRALLLLLALLALASPLRAEHCVGYTTTAPTLFCLGWMTNGDDACLSGDLAGRYYVQQDDCSKWCMFSIWMYEESNGIPGLQRGDEFGDDTCHGEIPPDTIVM